MNSNIKIPKNSEGKDIRNPLNEIRAPVDHIDTVRIEIYECLWFDKEKGICKEYENRPDICRNTSCIKNNSIDTIEKQYQNMINIEFLKLKNITPGKK